MPFFDLTSARDRARVPEALHATIESAPALVEEAEARVLREFTVQLRPGQPLPVNDNLPADRLYWTQANSRTVICLMGYDPSVELCLEGLREGLRDAVRKVVIHWARQLKLNHLEKNRDASGSTGSVSVEYHEWAGADLPPGWDAMLIPFDTRDEVLPNISTPIVTSFG